MAIGYFIGLGDKTSCGGRVLDADTSVMMFGFARAREGDRFSCGEDGETYSIVGYIHWTQAGGPGPIPGYMTHLLCISRAAKVIKTGGWIGTAIGGGASYLKVQEVCAAGETQACKRVRYTETGSFAVGAASYAAGKLGEMGGEFTGELLYEATQ